MVSFDVASLITNIPLKESIDLAVSYITERDTKLTFSKAELVKMYSIATSQTHFLFNGKCLTKSMVLLWALLSHLS